MQVSDATEATTEALTEPASARRRLLRAYIPSERTLVGLLLLLGAVAAGVQFNDQLVGLTGDNAEYILLALALATGQPYTNSEYPWGYPALISPVLAVTGQQHILAAIPWLKLITIVLFLGTLLLVYLLVKGYRSSLVGLITAAFFAINSTALLYANDAMSEIPYMFAAFAALLFWQRRVEPLLNDKAGKTFPWVNLLLAGLLAACAYYMRTVGLALLGAFVLVPLLHRRLKAALLLAALMGALALPWLVFSNTQDQPNYVSKLLLRDPYNPDLGRISSPVEFGGRIVSTADLYMNNVFPAMLLPPPVPAPVRSLASPLLFALVVLGFAARVSRRQAPEVYTLLFLLVLFAWPWRADRFLLPIYPLLLFYTLEGVVFLWRAAKGARHISPSYRAALASVLLIAFALPNLWLAGQAGAQNLAYVEGKAPPSGHTPDWQAYFAACRWLSEHTPPNSVVISRKSTLTEIYAERPSILIPLIPPTQYPGFVAGNHVTYILEDGFTWSTQTAQYLRPALKAYPGMFRLVETFGPVPTRIWQVTP